MSAVGAWRLALLFFIAGVAGRFLLDPVTPKDALAQAGPNDWTNFYRSDDYAVTAYYYLNRP